MGESGAAGRPPLADGRSRTMWELPEPAGLAKSRGNHAKRAVWLSSQPAGTRPRIPVSRWSPQGVWERHGRCACSVVVSVHREWRLRGRQSVPLRPTRGEPITDRPSCAPGTARGRPSQTPHTWSMTLRGPFAALNCAPRSSGFLRRPYRPRLWLRLRWQPQARHRACQAYRRSRLLPSRFRQAIHPARHRRAL